jgi:hypothetical protein
LALNGEIGPHQQSVRSSEGCCVDRLNSPPESGRESRHGEEIDFALSLDESVHVTLISFHNEPLRLAYPHIGLVRGETRTIIGGGLFVTFAGLGCGCPIR